MNDASNWNEALDQLEERVRQHRGVLWGASAVPGYEIPSALGPLPRELLERARTLLSQLQQLEADIVSEMVVLRSRLGRRPEYAPVPLYVDQRA